MAGEAIAKAGSAVGGIGKGVGSFFGLLFLKWRVTITLIFLFINCSGVIIQSFQDGNFYPVISTIGARLGASDEDMYWKLKDLEANNWKVPSAIIEEDDIGWWRDLKSSLSKINLILYLLFTGWYLYIFTYLLYKLILLHNNSENLFSIIFAIFVVVVIQSMYGLSMLYLNYDCYTDDCVAKEDRLPNVLFSLSPLKGTIFLGKNIINGNLVNALKEGSTTIPTPDILNQSVNQTNSTIASL